MLETLIQSLFIGFIASRLAIMAYDFTQYKEVLGWFKLWVCSLIFGNKVIEQFLEETEIMPKSEAQKQWEHFYDIFSADSAIIGLLSCAMCMSIWISLFAASIAFQAYDLNLKIYFFTPIFAYWITELTWNVE